jgi:hypothetical protein
MIHKTIDFTQNGGIPFNQDILKRMQDSYEDIGEAIVKLTGGNMILSGVVSSQDGWSDGWIVYNGQLLPFIASTGRFLEIVEETVSLLFEDGLQKPVIVSKYAQATNNGDFFTSIPMTPLALSYFMGERVTGPFPRAFDFMSIRDWLGMFYTQIKELQPIYSAKQVTNGREIEYRFNIPDNIWLEEQTDYVQADIYYIVGNGNRVWYKDMISSVVLSFNNGTVTVRCQTDNPPGLIGQVPVEAVINIYRRPE